MQIVSQFPSSFSLLGYQRASIYDELSMQQSFLFLDSLKEMKNLRTQLYSAADHFELSFTSDNQRVMNNLKDYVLKALVSTVDHLGSVSDKINALLDEKIKEVSGSELRIACFEQKLGTCQEFIDHEGLVQQSFTIKPPKYHKHYILPVGKTMHECERHAITTYEVSSKPNKEIIDRPQHLQIMADATHGEKQLRFRKMPSITLSQRAGSSSPSRKMLSSSPSLPAGKFVFTDKRSASPHPNANALKRSGSISQRHSFRSISNIGRSYSREPWKSVSIGMHAERNEHKEMEQGASRNIFKTLLSRRRSRKEDVLAG
ncbi:hypothetical protein J5N97_017418 [Dioscorea zingiberensis]|uniref:Protein ABIL2-like n=1 Tax=Dioscorea zingiberensis TaxID=325984 RepID=A0A9D5HGI6_9LILI|nr:hypothetical protein J5N97_017418 [Dioscorea zingiberensis]